MTPQVHFDDERARDRIRNSLGESLLVEASAGTGKTSELVRRIVRVLETGLARIDQVVAVTFTNKAAGELKLRLRQALDEARATAAGAATRASVEAALERLEEASIGTIHSFCAQVLRERPVEAEVDPGFEEIAEQETARIYGRAFRSWMQQKLGEDAPGLRRALARLAWRETPSDRSPAHELHDTGLRLVEWRDFPAPWRRPDFDRDREVDALVEAVRGLADLSARSKRPSDRLVEATAPARALAAWIERAEGASPRDFDALESLLLKLERELNQNSRKGSGPFAEGVSRQEVLESRQRLLERLAAFRTNAGAELAALLRADMQELVARYDELKRRSGRLDFLDLLLLVRNLVRDNADVRRYLQERFSHIFVDEFQDTDPLQMEILLLVASADAEQRDWRAVNPAPGKFFAVGDPKQSIYKFRRADVALYQSVRRQLEARGVGMVRLTRSFRSLRPIQECVNAAFAPEMRGQDGQAEYAPLEEHRAAHPGQPAVVALPAPRPYATHRLAKTAINACLPDAVAAYIDWLIHQSGWRVQDLESGRPEPIAPRHIAVLFRRFTNWGVDLTRDYVRGLEARGIPHLLVGSKSFHRREEVETLRAALTAVEWPEDELSVFAALKGSLFAIPDSTLLRFRHEIGRWNPMRPVPEPLDPVFEPAAEALRLLADLHRHRNRRPVADTLNRLLEASRSHAGFALRPAGHQVLANVYRLVDLARGFEAGGGISFRGFVEELEAQAEKAEAPDALVLEEGAEGVRLMTVHNAKGLEFPVVILADMTANLAASEPERHVDPVRGLCALRLLRCAPLELLERELEEKEREQAEGVRVAYVAATRARDLLVVPVVGDEERDGWLAPLNKAIYPPRQRWRVAEAPPGCPPFGEASVLDRPIDYIHDGEFSVKPGLHAPREGSHRVVWWDPKALELAREPDFGLRQEEILAEGDGGAGLDAYRRWREERERAVERGGRPSLELFNAADGADPPADFVCPVEVDSLPRAAERPAGRRFGTLVHELLRDAGPQADGGALSGLAAMHGRLLGAPREEIDAAVQAARAALDHPLLARARSAEICRRELPVILRLEGGRLLEGVIDLAFFEGGVWTLVDFKSDRDLRARRPHYERQVRWYALAVARITGSPVRAVLLGV